MLNTPIQINSGCFAKFQNFWLTLGDKAQSLKKTIEKFWWDKELLKNAHEWLLMRKRTVKLRILSGDVVTIKLTTEYHLRSGLTIPSVLS